jgi:hypothetical protein
MGVGPGLRSIWSMFYGHAVVSGDDKEIQAVAREAMGKAKNRSLAKRSEATNRYDVRIMRPNFDLESAWQFSAINRPTDA